MITPKLLDKANNNLIWGNCYACIKNRNLKIILVVWKDGEITIDHACEEHLVNKEIIQMRTRIFREIIKLEEKDIFYLKCSQKI